MLRPGHRLVIIGGADSIRVVERGGLEDTSGPAGLTVEGGAVAFSRGRFQAAFCSSLAASFSRPILRCLSRSDSSGVGVWGGADEVEGGTSVSRSSNDEDDRGGDLVISAGVSFAAAGFSSTAIVVEPPVVGACHDERPEDWSNQYFSPVSFEKRDFHSGSPLCSSDEVLIWALGAVDTGNDWRREEGGGARRGSSTTSEGSGVETESGRVSG